MSENKQRSNTLREYSQSIDCKVIYFNCGNNFLKVQRDRINVLQNVAMISIPGIIYPLDNEYRIMFVTYSPHSHELNEIRIFSADGITLLYVLSNISTLKVY